jgi:uncharacterized protein (DUF1800 family)
MDSSSADHGRREVIRRALGLVPRPAHVNEERTRRLARSTATSPAMRTNRPKPVQNKALPAPPPLSVITYNRLAFGPRPGDLAAFDGLGSDDVSRLTDWVDQQLAPLSIADTDCDTRISAAGFTTLNKSLTQLWQDHIVPDGLPGEDRYRPAVEVERATFLRAIHSKRQLFEVLVDFWHNHFNIYGWDWPIYAVWGHWDRDVIRANALGNFRTMIGMVAEAPAMLYYLDNYTSTNAGPNENWARELFELHTLGAENYLGVMLQQDVPLDNGIPIGYVDNDVFEATRAFTGWSFDNDSGPSGTGVFEYNDLQHDKFQKTVLGVFMPPNQPPMQDGIDVLDRLATHPGTGRHIAGKLCRRLISDTPPQDVIDDAAAVFTAEHAAPDQLAQVVRTIVLHPSFRTTWAEKVKRPFEIAVSAMRAAVPDYSFSEAEGDFDSLLWYFEQTGQPLFGWQAPDGFPDHKDDWLSVSPRVMAWRFSNHLTTSEENDVHHMDVVAMTPPDQRTSNEIVDYWIDRIYGRTIPAAERQSLVAFMAQGHNPTYDLPLDTDDDTRERLRALVALMFMSPSFLWR